MMLFVGIPGWFGQECLSKGVSSRDRKVRCVSLKMLGKEGNPSSSDGLEGMMPRLPMARSESSEDTVMGGVGEFETEFGFMGRARMGIQFTCNLCEAKTRKVFSRVSYEHGVVIVRCQNCRQQHLIADRLHYFPHLTEQGETVEEQARANGVRCVRTSVDALRFEELIRDDSVDLDNLFVPKNDGTIPEL
mmetsp:Transcript_1708/g.3161  ORF Transcript_1708/g.3161 Transcript_1708/m.3161 type:complete len:190 (+) Transcript_1708:3-572(+)